MWHWDPWWPSQPFEIRSPTTFGCTVPRAGGSFMAGRWAVLLSLFCFFSGHQSSGNPLVNSTVTNSLLLLFLLFFPRRESARVGRERDYITRERGGSILFCRAWFVITLAIKRKTMFVYCRFYSISSSSGTGRAAFSKKEFFAAVLLMSISAFEYIKFSVE